MPKERFTIKGQDAFTRYEKTQAAKRWFATRYQGVIIPMADVDRLVDLLDVLLTNPQDGDALVYDADTSKWVNSSGGSSSAITEAIQVSFAVASIPCDPSGFTYLQFSDVQGTENVGSDLSVVDGGTRAKIETAGGGSFGWAITLGALLAANPNDGTTRWCQVYGDSSNAGPRTSWGFDRLMPLLNGKALDFGGDSQGPYLSLPAGTQFGAISFTPVVGTADDAFALNYLTLDVWKIAPLPA